MSVGMVSFILKNTQEEGRDKKENVQTSDLRRGIHGHACKQDNSRKVKRKISSTHISVQPNKTQQPLFSEKWVSRKTGDKHRQFFIFK